MGGCGNGARCHPTWRVTTPNGVAWAVAENIESTQWAGWGVGNRGVSAAVWGCRGSERRGLLFRREANGTAADTHTKKPHRILMDNDIALEILEQHHWCFCINMRQ